MPQAILYKRTIFRLLFSISLWLFSSLSHLQFSLFIVSPIQTNWGTITLKHYAPQAGYFLMCLFISYLFWYSIKGACRYFGLFLWLVWLLLIIVINLFLLATPIENIHFIQYGLLSSLLLWSFNSTENTTTWLIPKVLFWATFAGIIDELLQYIWITASYSNYMDFNDFLLNMMGAIGGILFYTGFKPLKTNTVSLIKTLRSIEAKVFYLISLLLTGLYSSGYLKLTAQESLSSGGMQTINKQSILFLERAPDLLGSWQPDFNQGEFYVLAPLEGIFLLFFISIVFITLNSLCHQRELRVNSTI